MIAELTKDINLIVYEVSYIDQREPKPRTIRTELLPLDGGRISALRRLGQSPAAFIESLYARRGLSISGCKRAGTYTAAVDLRRLLNEAIIDEQRDKLLQELAAV